MFGFGKSKNVEQQQELPEVEITLTEQQQAAMDKLPVNEDGMVRLGDITFNVLGDQVQYISYYFTGTGQPNLVEDLRVFTDSFSYHMYTIHQDDVMTFLRRLKAEAPRYFN